MQTISKRNFAARVEDFYREGEKLFEEAKVAQQMANILQATGFKNLHELLTKYEQSDARKRAEIDVIIAEAVGRPVTKQ